MYHVVKMYITHNVVVATFGTLKEAYTYLESKDKHDIDNYIVL